MLVQTEQETNLIVRDYLPGVTGVRDLFGFLKELLENRDHGSFLPLFRQSHFLQERLVSGIRTYRFPFGKRLYKYKV
jgi:hypothetical protein